MAHANTSYDAIIIGSGMGGLTVASLMAQLAGKRVLVLEQHFKIGGFTHTFSRKGYSWDVGLHYVGQMGEGSQFRQLFDLITQGGVRWNKMPHIHECFDYPDQSFAVPDDPSAFEQALIEQFPGEAAAIHQYFHDIERGRLWYNRNVMRNLTPKLVGNLLTLPDKAFALQTTQHYLDTHFTDRRLKGLLVSQWGDYGVPPDQSAFAIHALIVSQYLDGGYYPEGGAGRIADAIIPLIEAAGGECRVNHTVEEILIENGRAVGVRVAGHGNHPTESFYAPVIISAAGVHTTYTRLLPPSLHLLEQREMRTSATPLSAVTVFVGFHRSPTTLGFAGENHWIYGSYNHSDLFQNRNQLLQGQADFAYLSFGSLRDPLSTRHTAQVIGWVDHSSFAQWHQQSWLQRNDSYAALKKTMSDALLDLVESRYPGFCELIAYTEVSTPLTMEHFTAHHLGAAYGIPATPERFRSKTFGTQTPIPGLFLAGSDVVSLGINGAMMGGVVTTAALLGPTGFFRILAAAKRASEHLHATV